MQPPPDTCHTPSEQETKPRPLVVAMSGLGDLLATTLARQVEAEALHNGDSLRNDQGPGPVTACTSLARPRA
jgi:hypothetical protein